MAQRYPAYFDGIVSGAPAMRTGFSEPGDAIGGGRAQSSRSKRRGQPGRPGQPLSEADKKSSSIAS